MLTRRELAALALAVVASPVAACGEGEGWHDLAAFDELPSSGGFIRRELVFAPDRGDLGRRGIWLGRAGDAVLALKDACSHQGCPVRYVPDTERFVCPCHGGVFAPRGKALGGPPRRPLHRYAARVRDGRVYVAWP
jgi:Rieske Fe-S protein